ncbi:hypothetical protein BGZ70_005881 [Mortierella alpina]|uniref:Uncharacterized protein n=1 Tax=Mortierella alpina TaxID=64518 RepID=A0A9P6JET0_MORAP|nr:hypothetical protein BGZ70_005881 [Mortierella alpina]
MLLFDDAEKHRLRYLEIVTGLKQSEDEDWWVSEEDSKQESSSRPNSPEPTKSSPENSTADGQVSHSLGHSDPATKDPTTSKASKVIDFEEELADLSSDGCGSLLRGRRRRGEDMGGDADSRHGNVPPKDNSLDSIKSDIDFRNGDLDWSESYLDRRDGDLDLRVDDLNSKQDDLGSNNGDLDSRDGDFDFKEDDLGSNDGDLDPKDGEVDAEDDAEDDANDDGDEAAPSKRWMPEAGCQFDSLEAARRWTESWAAYIGFKVRIGKSGPNEKLPYVLTIDATKIQQQGICNKDRPIWNDGFGYSHDYCKQSAKDNVAMWIHGPDAESKVKDLIEDITDFSLKYNISPRRMPLSTLKPRILKMTTMILEPNYVS